MKKIVILLVIMLTGTIVSAQRKPTPEQIEQFKSQKVSYMTDKLSLTPEEAQRFWPIYNEFDEARWKMHEQRRKMEQQLRDDYAKMTEKDFQHINTEMNDLAQKDLDLNLKYNAKFLQVLPAKKVVLIAPVENDFRFRMIKDFRRGPRDDND
ncbi:MAG: hypothetical protein ACK5MI_09020 [Mangrovibacterium sp.]